MGAMSDLDILLREAGIDPSNMELEEAIDLLREREVGEALDQDCYVCEVPDLGILYYGYDGMGVIHCPHQCRLAMPENIAVETIGLEDTEEVEG